MRRLLGFLYAVTTTIYWIRRLVRHKHSGIKRKDYSDEAEKRRVRTTAEDVFDLTFDRVVRDGAEANLVGIQSEELLFSMRLDSRTYFIQNYKYGVSGDDDIFKGEDEEQFEFCRRILRKLDIPLLEIDEEVVAREQIQVAQMDRETGNISMEEVQEGRNSARLSRQIHGLPVWSSNFVLTLTHDKGIGFMQLHWPEIPNWVATEAHRLRYRLEHGWSPPRREGAKIEAVQAGIIHSPAVGLLMDTQPVIRVIYASPEPTIGRKEVLHLNRHGQDVPNPRQADLRVEDSRPRERPAEE